MKAKSKENYAVTRCRELNRETERVRDAAPDLLAALQVVLDQVDYTVGNCSASGEPVGAVLDRKVIALARAAIAKATEGSGS